MRLRFVLTAVVLSLAACRSTPEERRAERLKAADAARRESNQELGRMFGKLPPCPTTPDSLFVSQRALQGTGFLLPPSYRQDRSVEFDHGGARFRSGDTTVDFKGGSYRGLSRNGCRMRIAHWDYHVIERFDSSSKEYRAMAMEIIDTMPMRHGLNVEVSAPRSVQPFLLLLLQARVGAR